MIFMQKGTVVGGWEVRKKLTTSLYEEFEESEVCQFGGFLPVQKLSNFLLIELRGFSMHYLRRFSYTVLSHSASNFLINQTRSE
jgi:hypothetical protein